MTRLSRSSLRRARGGSIAALLLSVLGLAGCTMGPDFVSPTSFSPESWFAPPPAPTPEAVKSRTVAEPIRADWWQAFGDPELTTLEQRVAGANLDIRAAALRLAESRAQRRITAADEFPQVNGDASYMREKPSPRGEFSLLGGGGSSGGAAGGGATGVPSSTAIRPFNLWQYGFDASWELDLWGRVRRAIEASDASVDESAEAKRDLTLSTMAELARDYVQLRDVQAELRIAIDNRAVADQSLHLTGEQAGHGMASQLDVANAAAQLASVSATIPQLEQRQASTINQLGFLLGTPPRALAAELSPQAAVPTVPPQVPIGVPSELAQRRPDIREAEAKLHAATAQIGVAEAQFYPSVTLNGSIDLQAIHFNQLASWDSRTYGFGPGISVPIFEGGRLKANLELTQTEQQEAAISFQRTVLNAWQEVDNALVAYDKEQRRDEQLRTEVDQTGRALKLAQEQYAKGTTTFLSVLDAERQALSAQQQEADSRATIATNLVSLYKALGGGWKTTGEPG